MWPLQKFLLDLLKKNLTAKRKRKRIVGPPKNSVWTPSKRKKTKQKKSPHNVFVSLHGKGGTIRYGREIQCLQYAEFVLCNLSRNLGKSLAHCNLMRFNKAHLE